jgi:hypothetical protein
MASNDWIFDFIGSVSESSTSLTGSLDYIDHAIAESNSESEDKDDDFEVEPELESVLRAPFTPLDESVDPIDFITKVMYENIINYQNIELAILGEEYVALREAAGDGEGKPSLGSKVKNGVKSIPGKAKNAKDAIIKAVQWFISQIGKFFTSAIDKVSTMINKIKAHAAQHAGIEKDVPRVTAKMYDVTLGNITRQAYKLFNAFSVSATDNGNKISDACQKAFKTESPTDADIAKYLTYDVIGSGEEAPERSVSVAAALNIINTSNGTVKDIKNMYNATLKKANEAISAVKSSDPDNLDSVKTTVNQLTTMLTRINKVAVSCITATLKGAFGVVNAATKQKKANKKAAKGKGKDSGSGEQVGESTVLGINIPTLESLTFADI